MILLYLAAPFLHQKCFCMRYSHYSDSQLICIYISRTRNRIGRSIETAISAFTAMLMQHLTLQQLRNYARTYIAILFLYLVQYFPNSTGNNALTITYMATHSYFYKLKHVMHAIANDHKSVPCVTVWTSASNTLRLLVTH